MSCAPLLRVDAASRQFGSTEVLRRVDLSVWPGEFVAIVGRSGSGKSTLLNLMGLLDRPSKGEVYLGEEPTTPLNDRQRSVLRSRRLSFVFQAFHLVDHLTAEENVRLGVELASTDPDQQFGAQAALQTVGLAHRAGAIAGRLSGGEKQRVAIARALARGSDILLCDEPTGSLDSHTSREVLGLIEAARDDRRAVVVVTHDPEVQARADRSVHIRDGRVSSGAA